MKDQNMLGHTCMLYTDDDFNKMINAADPYF